MADAPRPMPRGLEQLELDLTGPLCQRWRSRKDSYRDSRTDGFNQERYRVVRIGEVAAKTFVLTHHYAGSYPAARLRYGLIDQAGERLVGVAVLSVPVRASVLTSVFPTLEPYRESLELGRFVLLDEVPANAESWMLGRLFRLASEDGVAGLVAFSDPMPRYTSGGVLVKPGHVGTIYQATNATYLGRGTARTLVVLPDGSVLNGRAISKVRSQERGHEHVERRLIGYGARPRSQGQAPGSWLERELEAIGARQMRHPGNHRFGFVLRDRGKRWAPPFGLEPGTYPKLARAA
ncbi:MAG: Mom family adenine methylcarbamoylation protein [Candidatus Dormibacteria bacterium]